MRINAERAAEALAACGYECDELDGMKQQLAAALAACKQKDEGLRTSLYAGGVTREERKYVIEAALNIQPDTAALEAWLGEPVAIRYEDARGHYRYRGFVRGFDTEYPMLNPISLYAKPKGLNK